jgi:hypothetical protein
MSMPTEDIVTPNPFQDAKPLPKSQFPDGYLEDAPPQQGDGADLEPEERKLAGPGAGDQG